MCLPSKVSSMKADQVPRVAVWKRSRYAGKVINVRPNEITVKDRKGDDVDISQRLEKQIRRIEGWVCGKKNIVDYDVGEEISSLFGRGTQQIMSKFKT